MNYSDINNKWKQFLSENTFKEDKLISKDKKKKSKNRKDGKEVIVSEEDEVNEFEEFEESLEEVSLAGGVDGAPGKSSFISKDEFNKKWGVDS